MALLLVGSPRGFDVDDSGRYYRGWLLGTGFRRDIGKHWATAKRLRESHADKDKVFEHAEGDTEEEALAKLKAKLT